MNGKWMKISEAAKLLGITYDGVVKRAKVGSIKARGKGRARRVYVNGVDVVKRGRPAKPVTEVFGSVDLDQAAAKTRGSLDFPIEEPIPSNASVIDRPFTQEEIRKLARIGLRQVLKDAGV